MTIRNTDTGESFEVMVPDGLKIYEYNSNWLDSIPYLIERARYGEPWAYEALGDCYRYEVVRQTERRTISVEHQELWTITKLNCGMPQMRMTKPLTICGGHRIY